jgi:hypothetical protein
MVRCPAKVRDALRNEHRRPIWFCEFVWLTGDLILVRPGPSILDEASTRAGAAAALSASTSAKGRPVAVAFDGNDGLLRRQRQRSAAANETERRTNRHVL